jgi:hypothetical protein
MVRHAVALGKDAGHRVPTTFYTTSRGFGRPIKLSFFECFLQSFNLLLFPAQVGSSSCELAKAFVALLPFGDPAGSPVRLNRCQVHERLPAQNLWPFG